jgi:sulfonate transport system substrate-binding protein
MSTTTLTRRALLLGVASMAALAACGSSSGSSSSATSAAGSATTNAATATTAAATGTTAAAAPTTAAATTAAKPAVDVSKVTLRVGDQVKLTQSGLEAAGKADFPYKVEWAAFPSGPPLLEALNADAIDIGGVGDAPPIFSAAAGAKIKAVLATRTPQWNQGILVKDAAVTDVKGLKGRKVAVAKGSSANWILLKALQDNGLALTDIEIAYLQPTDAQQAFANGSVDAWVIWDPFSSVAQAAGAKIILTGEKLGIPGLTFQIASEKALGDAGKEAAIRDFLARIRAAQDWQRTNKDAWAAKYSELTKLPIEVTKTLLKVDGVAIKVDDTVVKAQQAEADAFFAAGLIPAKVDFAKVADARFNDVTTAG